MGFCTALTLQTLNIIDYFASLLFLLLWLLVMRLNGEKLEVVGIVRKLEP